MRLCPCPRVRHPPQVSRPPRLRRNHRRPTAMCERFPFRTVHRPICVPGDFRRAIHPPPGHPMCFCRPFPRKTNPTRPSRTNPCVGCTRLSWWGAKRAVLLDPSDGPKPGSDSIRGPCGKRFALGWPLPLPSWPWGCVFGPF